MIVHSFLRSFCQTWNSRLLILALLTGMIGQGLGLAQTNCAISQATFDSDSQFVTQHPPTHLRLMNSRYVDLLRAVRGLNCSGVPLVAMDGLRYQRAGGEEDPGLYYFVPEFVRIFHLSLAAAVDLTLIGTVLLATAVGLSGYIQTVKTTLGRRVGIVAFLLLTAVELIAGDVYIVYGAPAIACVPWILYFASRRRLTISAVVVFATIGAVSQTANLFRAHAGTGVVLFALVATLALYQLKPASRVLLLIVLLLAAAGVQMFFNGIYRRRSAFLGQQEGNFETTQVHPFWHSVYIGLGYINNSEVPAYRDEVAIAKVQLVRPGTVYLSKEYEQVLKHETVELAKRRPFFILENVAVKLAVVLLFCVCGANVGLYAAKLARKPIWFELAFWGAIAFNALFGILVVPNPRYLLGLIAFAVLYGVYSIEYASEQPQLRRQLAWIGRVVGAPSYQQQSSQNRA